MVWTQLNRDTQNEIIERLDNGESPYQIAKEYGLLPTSLARKYRRIKEKRNKRQQNNTVKPVSVTRDYNSKPKQDVIKRDLDDLITILLKNADSVLPSDKTLFVQTHKPLTILFYTDPHFGAEDQEAIDAFIRIAKVVKHDLIINGGDSLECYGLSKYGKDPRKIFTASLGQELKKWKTFSHRLNDVSDAPKMMIFGNHNKRYYDWLFQSSNQSLLDIEEMQLDNLMKLSEFGYTPSVDSIYFDSEGEGDYINPFLLAHHGSLARRDAGSSSRSESQNRGYVSTLSGHTHRASVAYKRTMSHQVMMAEGGTLRELNPDFSSFPDWAQGVIKVEYSYADRYISGSPILIMNGKAFIDGVRV